MEREKPSMFCLLQFLVLSTRCPTKEWIGRGQESSIAGEVGIPDRRTTSTGGREEKRRLGPTSARRLTKVRRLPENSSTAAAGREGFHHAAAP